MLREVNELIKQFRKTITQSENTKATLYELANKTCHATHSNLVLLNSDTTPILKVNSDKIHGEVDFNGSHIFKTLENIYEYSENTELNKILPVTEEFPGFYCVIYPLISGLSKLGYLLLWKPEKFSESELTLIGIFEIMATVCFRQMLKDDRLEEQGFADRVKSSIASLSFSELEAVILVLSRLEGSEGLVVAGNIAKDAQISRSVIVNAMRKLESAGLIETRSLGMKGTYIKVLNEYLFTEINKLKS